MADERNRTRWPWIVLALLVFYVLSIWPAALILGGTDLGYPGSPYVGFFFTFYYPLFALGEAWPPFNSFLIWYVGGLE
ncbi:MAG: hypothetical protein WD648_09160 [Planctomycetaceae bacterium]